MVAISQRARRRLAASTGAGGVAITKGGRTSGVQDPYAAHIAALQAIDPSGSYYTAKDYTASLSQAGRFVDAFGGALTYDSPNVMASPTRVVDATSGMAYASADGADDTAVGSAAETVDTYTAVGRSPVTPFSEYGAIIDHYGGYSSGPRLGLFAGSSTHFHNDPYPRGVRRNGVAGTNPFDLAPITAWMVVTIAVSSGAVGVSQVLQLLAAENTSLRCRLHLACLRKWPTAPSAAVVAATETELANYYAPLIATNP